MVLIGGSKFTSASRRAAGSIAGASGDYLRVQVEVTLKRGVALEVRTACDGENAITGTCVGPAQPAAEDQAAAQVPCSALRALDGAVAMYYGTQKQMERLTVDFTMKASSYLQMAFLPAECCTPISTGGALSPTSAHLQIHRITVGGMSWNACKFEYRAVSSNVDAASGRDLFLHNPSWAALPDPLAGFPFSMTSIGAVSESASSSIVSTLAPGSAPLLASGNPSGTPGCYSVGAAAGSGGAAEEEKKTSSAEAGDDEQNDFETMMRSINSQVTG